MNTTCSLPLLLATLLLLCGVPLHGGTPHTGKVGDEVIAHYTRLGDKEKLQAAKFLVENMKYHYFKDSPKLSMYFDGISKINAEYKYPSCKEGYRKLYSELGNSDLDVQEIADTDVVDVQFLIDNIDKAFDDWRNGLWARHLSFEDFCEYLLPYRIGNEKITKGWRIDLRKLYLKYARSVLTSDDMRNSAFSAAGKMNDGLRLLEFHNEKVLPQMQMELPLFALKEIRMGECSDYATFTAYVMRACGIPVCVDFTPQWPDRAHNHTWNSLLDNTGFPVAFMGAETNPGHPSKHGRKFAKVYRKVFAYQPQSLYNKAKEFGIKNLPASLNTPFIKDVSSEYFKGFRLKFKLKNRRKKDNIAYIAVFNNQTWVPVDFSVISKEGEVEFQNLGGDIVYMPVYWGAAGAVPAGNPLLLKCDGSVTEMVPQKDKLQTLTMNRKFPHFYRIVKYRSYMKNGIFEASNQPDFAETVKCGEVSRIPLIGYDTLHIDGFDGKYRYWRFLAPKNNACQVAELKFLYEGKQEKILRAFSNGIGAENTSPENVCDGNELTFYMSRQTKNAWIGVDMGKPVKVDKIVYLPRNDDNDIVSGHSYELCYFENGRQKSVGVQKAQGNTVTFTNVPSETIYILHDLEKGTEERIFSYDNNHIEWY